MWFQDFLKDWGNRVFDKLDANLAKAMLSIGAVKGFEIEVAFHPQNPVVL